jgi:hypothetical protein
MWQVASRALFVTCFHAGFLIRLLLVLDLEDGGDMILRNVGRFSMAYMALYPRRYNS